ncbi:hypothetical protein SDC9_44162 [bioreactor metagenome]|uniref:Uncharacterized protein n=1 Tax=bioreactor metagenome TaxID=1076179 RepID=A0A644W2M5_9ZZZZ
MTGQCKFDGNLFCFFLPTRKKEEGNPTHIAHIAKAPNANAPTKALPKSAILPTHIVLFIKDTFFILKNEIIILF